MDYFKSGEAEKGESSTSNREVQEEKEPSKSDPSSSVYVKATKEEVLRSNTDLPGKDLIIPVITDDEHLESLNSDSKAEKEESFKSVIFNSPVEKESKIEESLESNVNELEILKDGHSSVSVANPSNIDVSKCHPLLIDCTSSVDPNLEESSKSNISDKELLSFVQVLSMYDEQASETAALNLEEFGLYIHKEKLLNLHKELKQFHTIRNNTPKNLSENKTSVSSRPNKDSQPINKPITKSSNNTQLPSAFNVSKDSSELIESETESTLIESSRIPSQKIKALIRIVSSLLSTLSRNLETSRSAEGVSSASLENRISQSVNPEAPISPILGNFCEREFDDLNGMISNRLNRAQFVLNLISLFEHLLEDLLEFKAFVNGTGLASRNRCDDPDYGPTLDERVFASITEALGTRVESNASQNTHPLLSELIPTTHVAADAGRQGEPSPEATAEGGFESVTKFAAEQKTVAESVDSEPCVSCDSTSLQESTELHRTLELDPRLDAETNPLDISRQLLRLNTAAGYQLYFLVNRTLEVVDYVMNSHLFLPYLLRQLFIIQDALEHVVSLQQECIALLSRCRNREDSVAVLYILKVNTHIKDVYNKLFRNLSTNLKF